MRTSYQTIHAQDDFISYQKYTRASFPHQAALSFRQLAAPPKKSQNFLQPFLTSIPSFIKDTGHFLYILQNLGPLPAGSLLVTYDVTSLYTNIPLVEAERAVARMLLQARPHATSPSNQSLLRLLRHVFQGNIFSFSDGVKLHFYLQVNGVSMGSKCAPSVACTFMGDFERIHIHSLPPDKPKPLIWLRFIDDIFAIWTDGTETLADFTTWLNSRHPNIKFTCSHSETSVSFLDTTVLLKDGQLETELFIKPTSSLSYLQPLQPSPTCFPVLTIRRIPTDKKKLLQPRILQPLLRNNPRSLHTTRIWPCLP